MDLKTVCSQHVVIRFNAGELENIHGVLLEVTHGIRKCDLVATRRDRDSGEALLLLEAVWGIIDQMRHYAPDRQTDSA